MLGLGLVLGVRVRVQGSPEIRTEQPLRWTLNRSIGKRYDGRSCVRVRVRVRVSVRVRVRVSAHPRTGQLGLGLRARV